MSAHDYTADVRDRAEAAIAAVAELVEAVRDVYGDDCEQVCETSCPTCRIRRALAKFGGAACTLRDARPAPQQPAAVDDLAARLVDELDGLVSESGGVSGLHLNGDVATWEELLPGGRFERLSSLDELREALAAQQQEARNG